MTFIVLLVKAAITLCMNHCNKAALRLLKMHDWKSLALCWYSFSKYGREYATAVFTLQGDQYIMYWCLQSIAIWINQDTKWYCFNAELMVIFRMQQWLCHFLIYIYRLQICWLWITATKLHFNYLTYKTQIHLCFVDACFNVFSIYNLLPLTAVVKMVWSEWWAFWLIETWLIGQANPSNILGLVTFILLTVIYFTKWFLSPAILVFSSEYLHSTAYNSPIRFLWMKPPAQQHELPVEYLLTHSELQFLISLIPSHFQCINSCHPVFSMFLWPLYCPNWSQNIQCST